MIPPKNELLVVDTDSFPKTYEELLSQSTMAGLLHEKPAEARREVIDGSFLDETRADHRSVPQAIVLTRSWHPDPMILIGGPDRQTASFRNVVRARRPAQAQSCVATARGARHFSDISDRTCGPISTTAIPLTRPKRELVGRAFERRCRPRWTPPSHWCRSTRASWRCSTELSTFRSAPCRARFR